MSTTRIQLRGDTAANWTAANPVLADRELGLETDTQQYKVGNGSTAWNSLPYFVSQPNLTGGTNINITDSYQVNLDSNISLTSLSADTIYLAGKSVNQLPYDLVVAASDETTALTTGTAKLTFISPATFTLTGITASLTTTGSTASVVDVNYNGASVLSSALTVPSGNYYSATTTSTSAISQYGTFTVDVDTAGTNAAGLKILFLGHRPL